MISKVICNDVLKVAVVQAYLIWVMKKMFFTQVSRKDILDVYQYVYSILRQSDGHAVLSGAIMRP